MRSNSSENTLLTWKLYELIAMEEGADFKNFMINNTGHRYQPESQTYHLVHITH
jgi:hypothetical protein